MALTTPENLRTLQRKLYVKAKREPAFRFYALYDKVCRKDVLSHAYDLVKANRGSGGIDGVTCESIEANEGKEAFIDALACALKTKRYQAQPVRRVWIPKSNGGKRPLGIPVIADRVVQMACKLLIEPIFEADFCASSYGFRPGRSAHDAVDAISEGMRHGYTRVIDADLSRYFDTIPHDRLLKVVAKRIVDGSILALIKQWLKAPVAEENAQGKRTYSGGKNHRRGTPQGGVISPLLANAYLHLLDKVWEKQNLARTLQARLVRYADDFVILCAMDTERPMRAVQTLLDRLGLELNAEKTRIIDSRNGKFDFLGFSFEMRESRRTGYTYPHVEPSPKSTQRLKSEIKYMTSRRWTSTPMPELIGWVNQVIRGWGNYFHHKHRTLVFGDVRWYVEERVRLQLRRGHKVRSWGGSVRFLGSHLYERYGLYKLPANAPWKTRMP